MASIGELLNALNKIVSLEVGLWKTAQKIAKDAIDKYKDDKEEESK
ncbi:MAG: hypothetical protein GOV02_02935 [Candidatus Aenigmarchaeota archaeon]|nr:hypothetical protein [Candidatus Aenigmarchaeota archaeon]